MENFIDSGYEIFSSLNIGKDALIVFLSALSFPVWFWMYYESLHRETKDVDDNSNDVESESSNEPELPSEHTSSSGDESYNSDHECDEEECKDCDQSDDSGQYDLNELFDKFISGLKYKINYVLLETNLENVNQDVACPDCALFAYKYYDKLYTMMSVNAFNSIGKDGNKLYPNTVEVTDFALSPFDYLENVYKDHIALRMINYVGKYIFHYEKEYLLPITKDVSETDILVAKIDILDGTTQRAADYINNDTNICVLLPNKLKLFGEKCKMYMSNLGYFACIVSDPPAGELCMEEDEDN